MNIFYIWVALFLYLLSMVICTRFALCKFFFSLFSLFLVRAPAWKKCPQRQRFCAGALFHVFARRLAYIFMSLQSLMPTFSRLCIQQNTNYTCCEKEGYPLLPSNMIFVPSLGVLVVPPKNSHQPCHSAASPLTQTRLAPSNCTAHFRNNSSRGSANSAVYAVNWGGAIKAGTNHRAHKITYLREVISTTISLFLRRCVDSRRRRWYVL